MWHLIASKYQEKEANGGEKKIKYCLYIIFVVLGFLIDGRVGKEGHFGCKDKTKGEKVLPGGAIYSWNRDESRRLSIYFSSRCLQRLEDYDFHLVLCCSSIGLSLLDRWKCYRTRFDL